ncbi:vWA domain-containing protein [Niastella populi]|uniref:VWA containing CoxE family protein n=1 Tax=Niastella populi TaxID=550983 RepID=A0A1V9G648_9BACT|nr:VWA domain-containing protein [Niastella populi]OQP66115.1 VWA containing CoxE family protein [Niastella populi]
MTNRLTSLPQNIVQFCRYLRQHGFTVGIEEETMILQSLQQFDYTSAESFFLLLKMIICRSKSNLDDFDEHFRQYWKRLDKQLDAKTKATAKKKQPAPQAQFASLSAWLKGNQKKETEETASYSIRESLSQKDFSAVPDNEVAELMKCIRSLARRLAAKANRRYEGTNRINLPDLRQTLRKNLRRGGELIDIMHRRPKRNRVKLLMLCDVSKSMELYSAFLLQFMYAFQQVYQRMETFTFSTALQRLTPMLQQKHFGEALEWLSAGNEGWNSGTRIGESLHAFVNDYSHKLIDSKTIVIICSDGWDTGNIDLLKQSMRQIHTKAKKVIWLNPLAGYTAWRPEVAGMKAAMPFVDVFAGVYNIDSLRKLSKWI